MNNTNNTNSNATSVFIEHVKQVLVTLPPVTKFTLFFPTIFLILDMFTSLSSYIYLESDKVLYYLQSKFFIIVFIIFIVANFILL